MNLPRIALDAFGSDNCPGPELDAAFAAAETGTHVLLVGDRELLEKPVNDRLAGRRLPLELVHASQRIGMSDSPGRAVRAKPDASMPVAFDLVRAGTADAVVSAGHSGAMLACGLFKFGRIKGVDRPAIVSSFPAVSGRCCMLDMGANVECRPLNFLQFAVMGAFFAKQHLRIERPRIGVLSNGSESSKGTELTRTAHEMLQAYRFQDVDYIGYVEGKDMFNNTADVVVTDGFTGNIALKVAEGTLHAFSSILRREVESSLTAKLGGLLMRPVFRAVKEHMDPDFQGGAALLGVRGNAFVCHGASSAQALLNAVRLAARTVHLDFAPRLQEELAQHEPLFAAARKPSSDTEAGA